LGCELKEGNIGSEETFPEEHTAVEFEVVGTQESVIDENTPFEEDGADETVACSEGDAISQSSGDLSKIH
jgi:hypothetical protein